VRQVGYLQELFFTLEERHELVCKLTLKNPN